MLPMVVEQIDVRGVALLKAKDNPLVGADMMLQKPAKSALNGCSRQPGRFLARRHF
jgi:hypothetical protein